MGLYWQKRLASKGAYIHSKIRGNATLAALHCIALYEQANHLSCKPLGTVLAGRNALISRDL